MAKRAAALKEAKKPRLKCQSLAMFLLKEEIKDFAKAIKDDDTDIHRQVVKVNGATCLLASKQYNPHQPDWVRFLSSAAGQSLEKLRNAGSGAVLLFEASKRLFAAAFGSGRHLLESDAYEENFGLKVVLNVVNPDKVRSVDVRSLDAVPVSVRSQASIATEVAGFGLNVEKDLLYAATGEPINVEFGQTVTGKDSLKLSIPIELSGVPALLDKLLKQHNSDEYKKSFAWIDHLREVREKALVAKLDGALITQVKGGNVNRTWLAVPDILDWVGVAGFRYQHQKQGEMHADIEWATYQEFLTENDDDLSLDNVKKHVVYSIAESTDNVIDHWLVYKCIYGEVEDGGHTYALTGGKWYRVDADYLGEIDAVMKAIPVAQVVLPDYTEKNEAAYNEKVHKADSGNIALMDKKMIVHGGGSSKIEFCDLYTKDRKLIHVKRYGGSSVLSHLFSQGYVSAQLMLSDPKFREKVNAVLPASHKLPKDNKDIEPPKYEVVYAIASNSKDSALELPLFSKINLRNAFTQLDSLKFKVSITVIKVA